MYNETITNKDSPLANVTDILTNVEKGLQSG